VRAFFRWAASRRHYELGVNEAMHKRLDGIPGAPGPGLSASDGTARWRFAVRQKQTAPLAGAWRFVGNSSARLRLAAKLAAKLGGYPLPFNVEE
jgi:hypothetical protein